MPDTPPTPRVSDGGEPRESPQRRIGCACPSWTSARECLHLRHAPDDAMLHSGLYESCECACHYEDDDDE